MLQSTRAMCYIFSFKMIPASQLQAVQNNITVTKNRVGRILPSATETTKNGLPRTTIIYNGCSIKRKVKWRSEYGPSRRAVCQLLFWLQLLLFLFLSRPILLPHQLIRLESCRLLIKRRRFCYRVRGISKNGKTQNFCH